MRRSVQGTSWRRGVLALLVTFLTAAGAFLLAIAREVWVDEKPFKQPVSTGLLAAIGVTLILLLTTLFFTLTRQD